jgi:mannose/cellobiose epimerase-like protein (N-acyl-D-glucosamine 2-epimerase family)
MVAIHRICSVVLLIVIPALHAQMPSPSTNPRMTNYLTASKSAYQYFAAETEKMLNADVLDVWYPRSIDNVHGGFNADFARDWSPLPGHSKFSVFQGRMTWVAAQVALRRPALRGQYLPYVRHGADYLANVMWDKQDGGFFWGLAADGSISPVFTDHKHLYGISFCIYGLAAAYQATHNARDLELAQRAFRWTEEHAHDAKNGGYFEWLMRDGTPLQAEPYTATVATVPPGGFPVGYKSMNTHIHLLESFTELLRVWPDDTLRTRVAELQHLVRDVITVEPGAMNLYFTNAWQAVPENDSYGHDVEVTYLIDEAGEALAQAGATISAADRDRTEKVGRMLMDHALAYGWDSVHGGIYHSGAFIGQPNDFLKEWWVQMESLNTLLLLHERYGRTTDVYWKAFQLQWHWIQLYQVDHQFHGEYELIKPDGTPLSTQKGQMWKAAYHEARALMNVNERLERLASSAPE